MTGEAAPPDADRGRRDRLITGLATRARNGDKQAWDVLIERYAPLIWSICRRYRLSGADADDAAQNVWLLLVDHLDDIRDPAALPGWLATTTRRECGRVLRATQDPLAASFVLDAGTVPDEQAATADQELLAAERHAALREAFADLPPGCQQLLTLLIAPGPVPYTQISTRLGIAAGGIRPTRHRCLDKLHRHPAIAALIEIKPRWRPAACHPESARRSPSESSRNHAAVRTRSWPICTCYPRGH